MLLVSLVKAYAVRRAIRPNTTQFYHRCARQLSRHVGHPATVEDLPHLNELLAAKQQRRPAYRKSLRTGLVALWRFAAEAGLAAEPKHVAPVRLPAAPVHTWSPTEVERLRASAGTAFELAHPGQGHLFLGNSRDVFLRNYYDPRREPATLPHAPRLGRLG